MTENASLMRHRRDFARAIANHRYEKTDTGILLTDQKLHVGGVFDVEHRRQGDLLGRDLAPNLFTTQGLTHLLDVLVGATPKVNPWYMAIFEGNYTPLASLTGAQFPTYATECVAYAQANRPTYAVAAAAAGAVDNAASRAVFTMNALKTVYGASLLSFQAKNNADVNAIALAAARFPTAKNVDNGDELAVKYLLSATSA